MAAYELLAGEDDGLIASSPFNEIPGMLTRAIGDFASANDNPVHAAPADLLVDTRFEDKLLNFVGWAFVRLDNGRLVFNGVFGDELVSGR